MEESFRTIPEELGRADGPTKIMEHGQGCSADDLIAELNELRRAAGNPSLGELVRLSEHTLTRSTLHDHLAGQRSKLPPWRLVSAYVRACHAAARETGLDVEQLGTLEKWHALWVASGNNDQDALDKPVRSNSGRSATRPYAVGKHVLTPSNNHVTSSLPIPGFQNETVASSSVAPVIQRLEEDLSKLGNSLTPNKGLLVVTSGPTVGTRFLIEHQITTIGRDPENDVWLNEPSVSRHHAEVYRSGDRFFILDAESRNGTVVRGQLADTKAPLYSYEEVGIGAFRLMFLQGGDGAKASEKSYRPVRARLITDTTAQTSDAFPAFASGERESRPWERPIRRGPWSWPRRRPQRPSK